MTRMEELLHLAKSGDKNAAEALVSENAGLIWSVAKRFIGRGAETDDLYQLACLGFLKAIDGFDPEYGTQFSTYAVPKIAGEIRRFLRDDGAVKVPRTIKERAVVIHNAKNLLMVSLGREPTVSEIAEQTGLSVEDIAVAETATASMESIHRETSEDGFTLENVLTDTESEEKMVERISLMEALCKLSDRESKVIRLRYFHGLTQERVAKILSVSQVQVSRIEKKALLNLKELLR